MTQLFNITINGSVVTTLSNTCNISEEMHRFYNVATFDLNYEPSLESVVVINYGDKTFTGFVYKTSKIGKDKFSLECRTNGAKLTEPYSTSDDTFDEATTSHELVALYSAESGVPINITSEVVTFGGSYERNGTMLSALYNVANVTGAEFWDDGTNVQIQPNKAINTTGVEIPPKDIFDYVQSTNTVYNKGVGYVTIRNGGSETTDVISNNSIYVEVDECSGEIFVFTNPYGEIEHSVGISPLSSIVVDRVETNSLLDDNVISLNCAIESIETITLNGSAITDYNFEVGHNVIYFTTTKRGTLTVGYKAKGFKGFTNISTTPIGRFITFDIFYLDQVVKFEGLLSTECLNSSTDGDMVCITPNEMYYNQGFTVWTIGGDPDFLFYNRNLEIIRPVTSTVEDYISVEDVTLEEIVGGYRYLTRYPVGTALGSQSGGVDVPYTTTVDGEDHYFEFTQYYPKLKVSYSTPSINHLVRFDTIDNADVSMVIKNLNTDEVCEYQLDTKIPCILNQYIPVDVAVELGVEVTKVAGKTLSYLDPTETYNSAVVDTFGVLKIWVDMDGDYIIDTSSIVSRTSLTLTSNVNG